MAAFLLTAVLVAAGARAAAKVPMPEFAGISQWFNTAQPLTRQSLRSKAVLIDFWTYSCVNCLRTLPYLEAWYARYHAFGLEIVGVHSPEFKFEADPSNVRLAIERLGVRYPVAMDNDHRTWDAYYNRFWPAEYLVDREGFVRSQHFGEGHYRATEEEIRNLLKEGHPELRLPPPTTLNPPPPVPMTPEIYLGLDRLSNLGNSSPSRPGEVVRSSVPAKLEPDRFYIGGRWRFEREYAVPTSPDAKLVLRFRARQANMVLTAEHGDAAVIEVLIDGHPATPQNAGADVEIENERALCRVRGARLYALAEFHGEKGAPTEHTLELRFSGAKKVRAYTFTFG